MSTRTATRSRGRAPLTRELVLDAALRLADGGGIEGLSMRKLGQALGVEAMSLYNHVADKDDILAGIFELAFREIDVPSADADWRAAIGGTAISAHDALVRHPWAAGLMFSPAAVSPGRLRWMECVLETFRKAGFSPNMTHHAYHALDSHITGFTLWQVSIPFSADDLPAIGATFLSGLPADEYPYLAEHIEQHLTEPTGDDVSEFEFGLNLILDGLERLRAR
jgi:AcrR family transcriptional regulator